MIEPLKWGDGGPQALAKVSATSLVSVEADPDDRVITVDHSADLCDAPFDDYLALFAFPTLPEVTAVDEVRFVLLLGGLTGGGFRVKYDLEEGSALTEFAFAWTRRGVLDVSAG